MNRFALLLLLSIAQSGFSADTVTVPVKDIRPETAFSVTAHVFSRDGSMRIDACSDGKLRMYRTGDTALLSMISVAPFSYHRPQYSSDYSVILVIGADSALYRVDPVSGTVIKCPIEKEACFNITRFSNDGKFCIIYSTADSMRILWDLETGSSRLLAESKGGPADLGYVFTPDAKSILCINAIDSVIQLRNAVNDSIVHEYVIHTRLLLHAAFSPDGKQFAIPVAPGYLGREDTLIFLDVETGAQVSRIPAHTSDRWMLFSWGTQELTYSSDGTKFLAGSSTLYIVWDLQTGNRITSGYYPGTNWGYDCWLSKDGTSLLVDQTHEGSGEECLFSVNLSDRTQTTLYAKKEGPMLLASGFDTVGNDLYIGKYWYDTSSTAGAFFWDSIICWNGVTGADFMDRLMVIQSGSSDRRFDWVFSYDGRKLIQKEMLCQLSTCDEDQIFLYDLSRSGPPIYTRVMRSSTIPITSYEDHAFVCREDNSFWYFNDSSFLVVDYNTLDSSKGTFAIPDSWDIKAVCPSTKQVCALRKKQKSTFDTIFIWAGIWDVETGQCRKQFQVSAHDGDDRNESDWDADFTRDGGSIIFKECGIANLDTFALSRFDIQTGTRMAGYQMLSSGVLNFCLTPDGRQLLASFYTNVTKQGICCFDVTSGVLQRYYKTKLLYRGYNTYTFAFNPVNPRQFIYLNQIWELPDALPVVAVEKTGLIAPFRICAASPKRITFTVPVKNTAAVIRIFQSNGRIVARAAIPPGESSIKSIDLPGIAHGTYLYQVDAADRCFRGMFVLP